MYSMKETCKLVNMSYETVKFYCNEGLIPNVKRDKNNYRIFDEQDIAWIHGLQCLKNCGMGIKEMKKYMELCLIGASSIPQRKEMLQEKVLALKEKQKEIDEALAYIDKKMKYYDDVVLGKVPYKSNLIKN
ncbi:MAG: MerR family transcriptional regulator [Bacilli bacterium]